MRKFFTIAVCVMFATQYANAQVKSLELDTEQLNALLQSALVVQSMSIPTSEKIDSVLDATGKFKAVSKEDLAVVLTFMVPQLVPDVNSEEKIFTKCEPFANKYMKKIEASADGIVSKYPGTNKAALVSNLKVFFQQYLFIGLSKNGKLGMLDEVSGNEISQTALDKLFIEARGSEADAMIYFVMAHSSRNLFDPIYKEYKIPTFNYSVN